MYRPVDDATIRINSIIIRSDIFPGNVYDPRIISNVCRHQIDAEHGTAKADTRYLPEMTSKYFKLLAGAVIDPNTLKKALAKGRSSKPSHPKRRKKGGAITHILPPTSTPMTMHGMMRPAPRTNIHQKTLKRIEDPQISQPTGASWLSLDSIGTYSGGQNSAARNSAARNTSHSMSAINTSATSINPNPNSNIGPRFDTMGPRFSGMSPNQSHRDFQHRTTIGDLTGNDPRDRFGYLNDLDARISQADDGRTDFGYYILESASERELYQSSIRAGLETYASGMPRGDVETFTGPGRSHRIISRPADMFQLANLAVKKEEMINELITWHKIVGDKPPSNLNKLHYPQLTALRRQYKSRMESICTLSTINTLVVTVGQGLSNIFDGTRHFPLFGNVNLNSPENIGERFTRMRDKPEWKYAMQRATEGSSIGSNHWLILISVIVFELGHTALSNRNSAVNAKVKSKKRNEVLADLTDDSWD